MQTVGHQWVKGHRISHCTARSILQSAAPKKKRVYTQIRIGERAKDTQLYINKAQAPLATHKEIKINASE